VRKFVNIDGFGPPLPGEGSPREPERPLPEEFALFLDRQRAQRAYRAATSLDELVERRQRANARLPAAWLRYFVFHGARRVGEGWTWKSDPRVGDGFGPWKPEWIAPTLQRLRAPLLAVVGAEPDFYGPASDAQLDERLAYVRDAVRVRVPGAGHFVHMEQPQACARVILDFLTG
jgi:pimeloyl-ACP methyl ester carboxylesterase